MNYNSYSTATTNTLDQVSLSDIIWDHVLPWIYGKAFSLIWTFVSSLVSYSPFLLMTLIENKLEENKVKNLHQMHIRAREDYAMEEMSAYKEGDEISEYVRPEKKTQEEDENEEEEEEENEEEENEEEEPKTRKT